MPAVSPERIYAYALAAGFDPDEAATMTAIALAESDGDPGAHNTSGEDSRGLWQINARAHPDLATRFDLFDPAQNAQAAFLVSRQGADVSPWTTTHRGLSARYLHYRTDAQEAALVNGHGANLGVWTGTAGYGHPFAAGHTGAGAGQPAATTVTTAAAVADPDTTGAEAGQPRHDPFSVFTTTTTHGSDPSFSAFTETETETGTGVVVGGGADPATADALHRFLDAATTQAGDRYVYGAETKLDDRDPDTFDCSELVQWAAHQAGVQVDDGAVYQYRQMARAGTVISVDEALHTPGALLFSFNTDPGSTNPAKAHVAISLGNGKSIEARNSRDGVGIFDATPKRFGYAAMIPGISDGPAAQGYTPQTHQPVDDFDALLLADPAQLDAVTDPTALDGTGGAAAEDTPAGNTFDADGDGLDDAISHAIHLTADHDGAWGHGAHH